jgi:hypothetical protein
MLKVVRQQIHNLVPDAAKLLCVHEPSWKNAYDRVVALKNDPTNFFRMNHNIKLSKAAQAMS